ncbi:[protein-PII] uridylyltransferase [Erythrobacter arachoides]|uniref:Bifunctional uridylyltransferase/uridylyl-removing enzyme n=1 Tax=Aurantiacibacter arachoides TaxID=1850444 RepID=A0A844ZVY4_9SPHN|nr:[protein-PII] uridylyltransferase [Aurantiacibacter arachoides]MXO92045.1 [protein-PII] uridylyltransferase [Aurantiacibacter arachoides]GGD60182.1 bifunctional uridylyltransferase/uridylyl-removing enzyme [Aurantiacibacter arachoides]
MTLPKVPNQRKIVDRRALAAAIDAVVAEKGAAKGRPAVVALLRAALADGRAELQGRLLKRPGAGHEHAHGQAFLIDQLIRVIHDHVTLHVYPAANRSSGERIALVAVGGYGRGEMAPYSDVDLAFITPGKPTAWCEQVIEAILYYLWDLNLTVGHSSRSLDEMVRMAKEDLTIRTALLEARFLWGDQALNAEAGRRYRAEVVPGSESTFVQEKLEERNARHRRMGDSRYVVEPNVKDGKGGLRDLQTLYWIGKYLYRVQSAAELVEKGLFTHSEYRSFRRAEGFLLAVRAHLHTLAKRGEDRLSFDLQREVAARMNYADRPGKSAVERFMQMYFLQAKHVGHLTGVFLAHLEEETATRGVVAGFFDVVRKGRARKIDGFVVHGGQIAAPADDWFQQDPVRLIAIFTLAEREGLDIHPGTMRMARRDAATITAEVRRDPRANALFLDVLAGRRDPEPVLRWMNEAGVFGRFVPDFGKVNAQMQWDMYHHYTVDEHTIRAIGLLSQIERQTLADDHPLASGIMPRLVHRRVLYVATLLHDIAKGRGGDHSVLGADVARRLCPRLGMSEEETDLVAWLVRYHLLMSATAFKRDLSDHKTIVDFVGEVQSLERLRLLTVLTIVDIRAVGPGVWNSWKRQLLADLYEAAQERLRLGHKTHGRAERVSAKKARVTDLLGDKGHLVADLDDRFDDTYWIAEPEDVIALNLPHYAAARDGELPLSIEAQFSPEFGATLVTVIGNDHPGLFFRIAGAIHLAGGNVIDARIHTNRVGKAVDNFLVQDPLGKPFSEASQLARLRKSIEDALADRIDMVPSLAKRPLKAMRAENFSVAARVTFDNGASNRFTVIEVNATDRPALLNRLTRAMFEQSLLINSAHIAQYGERAVDTFYVTDLLGTKIHSEERLGRIEAALLEAIAAGKPRVAEAAE